MTRGHLRFAQMLADLALSEREAAERLECSQSQVNYLKRGLRDPGRKLAEKIREISAAEWSEGAIEIRDWDEILERPTCTGTED